MRIRLVRAALLYRLPASRDNLEFIADYSLGQRA